MGNPVNLAVAAHVTTPNGGPQELVDKRLAYALTAALGTGDKRQYSIATATFQALTVPSGATYCIIIIPAGAESVFLKNVTGDSTGIALTNATSANVPEMVAVIPVDGTSPGLGLLNSGASTRVFTVIML